ncbi:hypothetical protein ACFCZV_05910 [Streptomyces hydrogenans]|uniref:hypothetical protein n=1 Tax=Streptomyces hydrogenans TaxID=1873719 RepID=UPI0035DCFD4B
MAVVAGVLFLAFVYFVFGKAAVLRNGAQTAADAAALGAAQDARDQLREGWLDVAGDPAQWQVFIQGSGYTADRACQKAIDFASVNDALLLREDCLPSELGFTVTVQTKGTVGESIVPGADLPATATASAVIEPLCTFDPPEQSSEPSPGADPSPSPEEPEDEEPEPISGLDCGGEEWVIDPADPELPGAEDLFSVRLTGDNE